MNDATVFGLGMFVFGAMAGGCGMGVVVGIILGRKTTYLEMEIERLQNLADQYFEWWRNDATCQQQLKRLSNPDV